MEHKSKNRDRLLILYQLLKVAKEPIKQTPLMGRVNINHKTFCKIIEHIESRGLVERRPTGRSRERMFLTTSEGRALCELLDRVFDILGWSRMVREWER